jgi:single-strand DNA-binding protein
MIHAVVMGRLGKDPDTREVGTGTVTSVSVATDHGWGERKTTTWVRVSAWGKLGETLARLAKGNRICAAGELFEDCWTDKDNKDHSTIKLDAQKIDIIDWPERQQNTAAPVNKPPFKNDAATNEELF